jgi:hypothetical protein
MEERMYSIGFAPENSAPTATDFMRKVLGQFSAGPREPLPGCSRVLRLFLA